MAAATVTATSGATTDFDAAYRKVARLGDIHLTDGLVFVTEDISHTVATTNIDDIGDEIVLVTTAPKNSVLAGVYLHSTDIDTNASPAVVWKLVIGADDVVTGLTLGQAAGHVNCSLAIGWDTSEKQISIKVTTVAATGATGTITARFMFASKPRS